MAKHPVRATRRESGDGFDVTVERSIGRVEFGAINDVFPSPIHAAFSLIANDAEEGRYAFPGPNGNRCVVTVAWEEGREAAVGMDSFEWDGRESR